MGDYWNSWGDTAKRLFVPFGQGADRDKSPVWDLGGKFTAGGKGESDERDRKQLLRDQAAQSGTFADQAQQGYGSLGTESAAARAALQRLASGQDSVSAEQLRQGLQQNLSSQRSFAAGGAPQDATMRARTAALAMGRAQSGLAGQQAVAGLQERQAAQQAYAKMLADQRQQELNAAIGSRANALQGYGAGNAGAPEKSNVEKYGPAIIGALGTMFSDRRLKHEITDGDEKANAVLEGLRSYNYKYRDESHGKGVRLGVMAQELETSGLGHTVIDTPRGKMVDGAQLAASNTALVAALARRVKKLEGGE